MARLIFLDNGTLGVAARLPDDEEGDRCQAWIIAHVTGRELVIIPEPADNEVWRSLLKAGAREGLERLDGLKTWGLLTYLPFSTEAMLRAAGMWADVRRRCLPTAGAEALDGATILAGQAVAYSGHGEEVIIAIGNRRRFSRLAGIHRADEWAKIT